MILQRKRTNEDRLREEEEDYADVPETPLFDNKDEEEELMVRRTPQMKRKRPLTRLTVKREERNITAPMIEVSGPDGPMMVFRPWSALEAREAMAYLPDVSEGGDKLSTELGGDKPQVKGVTCDESTNKRICVLQRVFRSELDFSPAPVFVFF
ncbi:hypothetical protein ROHU_003638 [Labeo rohita]|uniref:Uncharacterized protein n=1 Tax=Labeo rohita TaxID=84645 RepID=A0A498NVX7_LABRO|nr:hypothetical protein ROHU_003638 [Labeo rohita]